LSVVDPSDPQSWNRYAYVTNRPLDRFDPLGLDGCDDWGCDDGGDGGWDGNFGESLGIPTSITIVGPSPNNFNSCDFFACGTGTGGASNFISGTSGDAFDPNNPFIIFDQVWTTFLPDAANDSSKFHKFLHNDCLDNSVVGKIVDVADVVGFGGLLSFGADAVDTLATKTARNLTAELAPSAARTGIAAEDITLAAGANASEAVGFLSGAKTVASIASAGSKAIVAVSATATAISILGRAYCYAVSK